MRAFVHILFAGTLTGFLSIPLSGCASDGGGASEYREDFQEVFGGSGGSAAVRDAEWAILLRAFSGSGAMERAESAAEGFRANAGLDSARAVARSNGAVVIFGAYDSPDDRNAQRDLERLKSMEVQGAQPFAAAFLAPQGGPDPGTMPELNLAEAKQRHGQGAKYTLQIAVYESDKAGEAKRAAEQAAAQLRRDGEMAFYYHGPTKSMVTLGLFGDRDYDPSTDRRSERLRSLERKYPHNLLNGRTIIERRIGGERVQPSTLVMVPGG